MAEVSERTLQVSVLVAFASGVLVGWQANRLRRRYLDWRERRLQDWLATTQKKLDLAGVAASRCARAPGFLALPPAEAWPRRCCRVGRGIRCRLCGAAVRS
ncbi:mitoregulin-like [Urocitellus parryii]